MSATVPGKQTPVGFVLTPPEVMSPLDDLPRDDYTPRGQIFGFTSSQCWVINGALNTPR